ncbi:hypothetical protein CKO11_12460 [Rhodobacter sp. TJ_12]|uniref:hypothetical protein n=1 Tax=Rhodobacter sp. TJ_12 TaxID=2029399 RepID=UPI001CBCE819|nr:hypothetical protein [Rhodobacter sp. TJ_12]MBZ4023271.1 hypothetical protein [Rhodobacter sp. TJ_12]
MEVIDGNWIKQRLTGRRGEKTELAQALGISLEKVTKTLSGSRRVQPEEIPKVIDFFRSRGARSKSDTIVEIYERLPPKLQEQAEEFLQFLEAKVESPEEHPVDPQAAPQRASEK